MSLRSRTRATLASVAALILIALLVVPVAAKEDFEARFDAPLSLASAPGSTLHVGWTVFQTVDGREVPISGLPVELRIHSGGNAGTVSARGVETPVGSGHFEATLVVPSGGIGILEMAVPNEQCVDGTCTSWDLPIHLTGDLLVAGTPPGAVVGMLPAPEASSAIAPVVSAGPVTPVAPAVTPVAAAPAADVGSLLPWVAAAAVALGVVAVLAVRPRRSGPRWRPRGSDR